MDLFKKKREQMLRNYLGKNPYQDRQDKPLSEILVCLSYFGDGKLYKRMKLRMSLYLTKLVNCFKK